MLQQMPNSVAFLTPRSISNKEDTGCKGEAELQICTVSTSLYSERNLTGLYIAFKPQFIAVFFVSVRIQFFLTLPFTNFFQLEPDSNCNYNDFMFHKKYNLLFSTTKRTELSSFLHSFSFINILAGISLQSCELEYHSFIPLLHVILTPSESTYFCHCLYLADSLCIIPIFFS